MAKQFYNRYVNFLVDGEPKIVPYINLQTKPTDKKYIYKVGQSRLDKISEQYYGTPFFGWLILQANPNFGSTEWNIPDSSILTIPFPLVQSLQDYKTSLDNYFLYYGR